jgi:hypothetical protein
MASGIRISQLQEQFVITPNDVFVINDENTNTRRITYTNLLKTILSEDLVFDGDVIFNGNTNLTAIDGGNALTNQ